MKPQIIEGGISTDGRGTISFVNDFKFADVCRFYTIEHHETNIIRAWQGHRIEKKYFYVTQGSFVVAWVKIDKWESPSTDLRAEFVVLSSSKSQLLIIPAGYANGIKALEDNSKIVIFSDMTVEESIKEKIRYDSNLWLDWNNIKH